MKTKWLAACVGLAVLLTVQIVAQEPAAKREPLSFFSRVCGGRLRPVERSTSDERYAQRLSSAETRRKRGLALHGAE